MLKPAHTEAGAIPTGIYEKLSYPESGGLSEGGEAREHGFIQGVRCVALGVAESLMRVSAGGCPVGEDVIMASN